MSSNTPHEHRQMHEVVLSERERQYLGLVARGKHPSHVAVIVGADEADVKAARRIHAQSPGEFRERYLEARGLTWMADFIRQEKGARPGEAAAAAD